MRFEELIYFVSFVEMEPETLEREERIYEHVKRTLNYSRDAFELARDKYNGIFHKLSQTDILEIKRTTRDFDAKRREINELFDKNEIDYNEKIHKIILCVKNFEQKINMILNEPPYEKNHLVEFSFISLFQNLLSD